MAKDFDDFARRCLDDADLESRLSRVGENVGARMDNGANYADVLVDVLKDVVIEHLRAYHAWVSE